MDSFSRSFVGPDKSGTKQIVRALKVCINGKMSAARLVVLSDVDNFSSLKCGRETYLCTSAGVSLNN